MLYFDRFDICAGYYCFAVLYHSGQWSPEYAILGRLSILGFSGGLSGDRPGHLSENARAVFDGLVERSGFPPYSED